MQDTDQYCAAAEQDPLHEFATKDDVQKLAKAIIRLRNDRMEEAEAELRKLADDYRRLRQELLPVFKMAKERSEPLPNPYQAATTSPEFYQQEIQSPTITQTFPEKSSLTRTFSKKLFSSTPKNNSPTHLPSVIHEGKSLTDTTSLDPSAAATAASNHLTASMSGGSLPGLSPSNNHVQSPTSPLPYSQHQPLAPRSYARDGNITSSTARYDGADDSLSSRPGQIPTPPITRDHDPPNSASSLKSSISSKANPTNSTLSTATTVIPSAHSSLNTGSNTLNPSSASIAPSSAVPTDGAPSVEIFKSFRVGLEDPCYKVLPAALRKYNIQADWRQYALYIVYGDQERAVGMDEKPLALFKDLDREGKKPMFMLRRLASSSEAGVGPGLKPPGPGGGGGGN